MPLDFSCFELYKDMCNLVEQISRELKLHASSILNHSGFHINTSMEQAR